MPDKFSFLRYASPNEQRTISREDLGFYHAVVLAASYELSESLELDLQNSLFSALHACISQHSFLSVIVEDMHTDKAYFRHVSSIDLQQHINIADQKLNLDCAKDVETLLASEVDTPFRAGIPPWRVRVYPLQTGYFIVFSFSHALGDAISAKAFHRTLLSAIQRLRDSAEVQSTVEVPLRSLPGPFDTPKRLTISWSFLLAPFVALFLPLFLIKMLGLRTSASTVDINTWTGSSIFAPRETSKTQMKFRQVPARVVKNALVTARKHDAKFTGLFQHLVVRALSKTMIGPDLPNFVSGSAVNMRKAVGVSDDQFGLYVSAGFIRHARSQHQSTAGALATEEWATIRSATQTLARVSATLHDQPTGLLRYLPSVRKWTADKIGQPRDCSFEVSNIGTFEALDLTSEKRENHARITQMIFATPGAIVGGPLEFRIVSVKNGPLVYTVGWRGGSLDIGSQDEGEFVEAVCTSIEHDLIYLQSEEKAESNI